MLVGPILADGRLIGGPQHIVDAKGAAAHQLFHVCRVGKNVKVEDGGGVHPDKIALLPPVIAVALAGDLLLQLVADGVNALGQKAAVGVRGPLHGAVDQHRGDEKAPCRKIKNVLNEIADVPAVSAFAAAGAAAIGALVAVPVKFRQHRRVAVKKRLDLFGDHFRKFCLKVLRARRDLVDMDFPVLSPVPLVSAHGRSCQPVIGGIQPVDHRPHGVVVEL